MEWFSDYRERRRALHGEWELVRWVGATVLAMFWVAAIVWCSDMLTAKIWLADVPLVGISWTWWLQSCRVGAAYVPRHFPKTPGDVVRAMATVATWSLVYAMWNITLAIVVHAGR